MDNDKNKPRKAISPLDEDFDVMNIDLDTVNLQADFTEVSDEDMDAFSNMLEELDEAVKERKVAVLLSNDIQSPDARVELTEDGLDLLLAADQAKESEITSYWQDNDLISHESISHEPMTLSETTEEEWLPLDDFQETDDTFKSASFWMFADRIANKSFFGKRLTDLSHVVLGAVVGLLLLFIATVFVVAFRIKSKIDMAEKKPENAITIGHQEINKSNQYMYINDTKKIDNETITLVKMLLDNRATIFCIDTYLDANQYDYTLTDDLGFDYELDQDVPLDNPGANLNRTVLRFIPVHENMGYLNLEITSKESKESIAFRIAFDTPPTKGETLWYTGGTYPFVIDDLTTVLIDEAYFSPTGNSLFYSLHSKDITEKFIFAPSERSSVFLMEGAKKLLHYGERQGVYEFAERNILAGRIDTFPLQSYGAKLSLLLQNLIHEHEIKQTFQATDLYYKNMEKPLIIEKEKYRFVVEGLDLQGNTVVLVAHGEVKPLVEAVDTIPNLAEDRALLEGQIEEVVAVDMPLERIRISMDADLMYMGDNGIEKTVAGFCRSKEVGADITFNLEGIEGNTDVSNMTVRINSLSAYIDEIQLPIYIEKSKFLTDKDEHSLESMREQDIERALLFDLGTNVSTADNWDEAPKQHFSYVAKTTNHPEINDNTNIEDTIFYATIRESRKGIKNKAMVEETYIHQIEAINKQHEWVILK